MDDDTDILNVQETVITDGSDGLATEGGNTTYTKPAQPNNKKRPQFSKKAVLIFTIILVAVCGLAIFFATKKNSTPASEPPKSVIINTQSLDAGTLNQLTSQLGPGNVKQQLTISPDTLFKNNVDIEKNLTVKGKTLLQDAVTVSNDLTVTTQLKVGSNTSIGGNLNVNGQISAGTINVGSITLNSLRLSGDLAFSGHVLTTGPVPSAKAGVASGGGSTTINGNDTSGTITIKMGNSPLPAGETAIVTFGTRFSSVPRVQLTPVSLPASKLDYFVTKTPGFFTVESTSQPTAGESYSFDYFVSQ